MDPKQDPISILLVTDNRALGDSIEGDLAEAGRDWFGVARAPGSAGLVERIDDCPPDLVLIDWHCAGIGQETISNVKSAAPRAAVVVLMQPDDTNIGPRLLRAGAEECVCPANLNPKALRTLFCNTVQRRRLRTESDAEDHARRARLERLLQIDEATGLHNAGYFAERLEREILRSMRYGNKLTLAAIDLLDRRELEASHGPEGVKALLRLVAEALKRGFRRIDEVACLEEGRFAVLCIETSSAPAVAAAERILSGIESSELELPGGGRVGVSLACGVAEWNRAVADSDLLLYTAQQALHQALESPPGKRIRAVEAAPA